MGIIETMGEGFIRAFDIIDERKPRNAVVVIREELLEYLLPGLNDEPMVFKATEQNRDCLPNDIFAVIK